MTDVDKVKANPDAAAAVIAAARTAVVDVQSGDYMDARNQIDAISAALAELDKG